MECFGTILVVDNNEPVCAFIELALRHHGFTVFTANCGRKAINLFREHSIDIVLMDVGMPDLSGPETLEILQSIRFDVLCFFMTASSPLTKEHLTGVIDVFQKPFQSFSEVVRTFAEYLDKRRPIKHSAHQPSETHLEQKSSKTLHEN
jgi:CheY-like chemotaxis protein